MKMSGEQRIAATRQQVWEALNDPEVLRRCIPGCQSLTKESDTRMVATVEIKIGPIGARFNGAVELADIQAPESYTLIIEGQGGTVGSVKSIAKVRLSDDAGGTLLSYDVDAQVAGRLDRRPPDRAGAAAPVAGLQGFDICDCAAHYVLKTCSGCNFFVARQDMPGCVSPALTLQIEFAD